MDFCSESTEARHAAPRMLAYSAVLFCLTAWARAGAAQEPAAQPIASVSTNGVILQGALRGADGRAAIANNGEVTAGEKTAEVTLARGGSLAVCASTTVHLSRDTGVGSSVKPAEAGLMLSLSRGAFEANYTPGSYSDVLLTPDLRLLVSGPGRANLKVRVDELGDTCIDNAGDNAPYVVASSVMDGGAYRVRPGQRVLFVGGSLGKVVDNERESCGCPTPAANALASAAGDTKSGGPSSTPADTAFPTAVSEGLAPLPGSASSPAVPSGRVHAQVGATFSSSAPPGPPPPEAAGAKPVAAPESHGFFHALKRFFAKLFGAE